MFTPLDKQMFVAPQIDVDSVRLAAMQGITTIINNRPDEEDYGQPESRDLEVLAKMLGIDYRHIPVTHAGMSALQIDQMVLALSQAEGAVLAFCRSGTRSTLLWALARAKMGDKPDELAAKAQAAGYDLTPIRAMLDMLSAK
jgi:uncharacterized protein (TIGR01244 family)